MHNVMERFMAHKLAVIGLALIILLIILVIVLPPILKLDPYTSFSKGGFNQKPSAEHWLGTDRTGRDIFARLVYGGRISLVVGLLSTVVSMAIGVPLGLLAGYYRGWVETVIMRLADIFMSFPAMMLDSGSGSGDRTFRSFYYRCSRHPRLDSVRETDSWPCAFGP